MLLSSLRNGDLEPLVVQEMSVSLKESWRQLQLLSKTKDNIKSKVACRHVRMCVCMCVRDPVRRVCDGNLAGFIRQVKVC